MIEFIDEESLTVKIKVKYAHDDAGFHLTFYADTLLLVETPLLLPKMRFFKGTKFGQATEHLPGHMQVNKRKYFILPKDPSVVVGI